MGLGASIYIYRAPSIHLIEYSNDSGPREFDDLMDPPRYLFFVAQNVPATLIDFGYKVLFDVLLIRKREARNNVQKMRLQNCKDSSTCTKSQRTSQFRSDLRHAVKGTRNDQILRKLSTILHLIMFDFHHKMDHQKNQGILIEFC